MIKRTRHRRQAGRAHIDLVVLLTCIGTLAIVTSPGQSEPASPEPALQTAMLDTACQAATDAASDYPADC